MRLFFAYTIPTAIKDRLGRIIEILRPEGGGVKWVRAANIHITARFLGDTEEARVPKLIELANRVASNGSPVYTSLGKLGAFPDFKHARVLWAGLGGDVSALGLMATQLEEGIQQLGFEPERKGFKPHLTLGRLRRNQGIGRVMDAFKAMQVEPTPFTIDELVLFESTLTPKGPIYDRLHTATLGTERFG